MEVSHSYIIEYPKGKQRDALLRDWIKKLLVTERSVGPNEHEDVHYMECSGKLGYKVSDADAFIESLMMMPHGLLSFGVIDNAESMSEVVQNKLLKTIEEPPARTVVVLLTANRNSLLQTIRSRCTLVRFKEINERDEATCIETGREWDKAAEAFFYSNFFHEFRKIVEKEINSKEDAINFIDNIIMIFHNNLFDREYALYGIEKTEELRIDIIRGMGYTQGLKRLFLELRAENN